MRRQFVAHHHSTRCAAVLFWMACAVAADAEQRALPYDVTIAAPGAPVMSGPGDKFYTVDTLAQGEQVEVHRERADGWLGIRPPADSFSWVFGRHVKLLDNGLAEVAADDVASRIGSRLGDERNAVQVQLKKGELVEVIGQQSISGQTWYKIAPPAGEFRWIHTRYVSQADADALEPQLQSPIVTVPVGDESADASGESIQLAADAQPAPNDRWHAAPEGPSSTNAAGDAADLTAPPLATNATESASAAPAPVTTNAATPITTVPVPASAEPTAFGAALDKYLPPTAPDAASTTQSLRGALESAAVASGPPGDVPSAVLGSPDPAHAASAATLAARPAARPGSAANAPAPTVAPVASPAVGPIPDGLSRQLIELEMQLSRAVAEPPTNWQIEPLASEAERLLAQAQTVPERAAVQTTLAKIDRFAAIGRRYRFVGATGAGSGDPLTALRSGDPRTALRSGDPRIAAGGTARIAGNNAPTAGQFNSLAAAPGQPPITPIAGAATGIVGPDGQQYDAVGILRPVVSKRPGAPQFALLNDRGQVVSFVTPTPDVNLQPYVGHRVGVTGNRGFIPEFQRAHVTAGRVAPFTGQMLR